MEQFAFLEESYNDGSFYLDKRIFYEARFFSFHVNSIKVTHSDDFFTLPFAYRDFLSESLEKQQKIHLVLEHQLESLFRDFETYSTWEVYLQEHLDSLNDDEYKKELFYHKLKTNLDLLPSFTTYSRSLESELDLFRRGKELSLDIANLNNQFFSKASSYFQKIPLSQENSSLLAKVGDLESNNTCLLEQVGLVYANLEGIVQEQLDIFYPKKK